MTKFPERESLNRFSFLYIKMAYFLILFPSLLFQRTEKMTRSNSIAPQVILLFVLGSGLCIWGRQVSENYEKMRMLYGYPSGFKRLPSYDFGLGKRSVEDSGSYEEQLSPMDALMEREAIYPYPIGKRTRAYSFGLGKRLTQNNWKFGAAYSPYRFATLLSLSWLLVGECLISFSPVLSDSLY